MYSGFICIPDLDWEQFVLRTESHWNDEEFFLYDYMIYFKNKELTIPKSLDLLIEYTLC